MSRSGSGSIVQATMVATGGFILGSLLTIAVQFAWKFFQSKSLENNDARRQQQQQDTIRGEGGEDVGGKPKKSTYDLVAGVSQSGFLTELVEQMWPYINKAGCKIVKETVEPMFAKELPGPLKTLHFSKLDLGNVPLRLDNIVVHQLDRTTNTIQFELDVIWDGECDIELKTDYIGTLGVRHVKLSGRMSVIMKPLVDALPIVQAVQYGFINPPTIKIDFTGLAQIADIRIIDRTVRNCIQSVLQGMMVLPYRMVTKLDDKASFYDVYQPPIGVARITVSRGRGFKAEKQTIGKDDIRDVYCTLKVGTSTWKTSAAKDTLDPVWNETYDVLLYDHDQVLYIEAWDQDNGKLDADDYLGHAEVTIGDILLAVGRVRDVELSDKEDISTGAFIRISADLCPLVTRELKSLEQRNEKKTSELDKLLFGVVTILVGKVTKIPIPNEKDANCLVKVEYGSGSNVTTTTKFETAIVQGLNPVYDSAFVVPITDQVGPSDVTFQLISNPGPKSPKGTEPNVLGTFTVTHQDLVNAPNHVLTEKRAVGSQGAVLDFQVKLNAVQLPTASEQQAVLTEPSAVMEVHSGGSTEDVSGDDKISVVLNIKSGRGFQKQKRRIKLLKGDIPDIYVKVQFGPFPQVWRTQTIKDCDEPTWNETKQYDGVHYGMMVSLEAYDYDSGRLNKDDLIGTARISVGKLLLAGGGQVELELQDKTGQKGTGAYITLACTQVQGNAVPATDSATKKSN